MSSTLNPDQHVSLKILEGETSSILTTAVIKLFIFHAKDERWLYTGLSGALCLVIDRKLKGAVLFRLYDLNLYDIVFEQEVYYEFLHLYQEINEQFFCFPVIGNFVFGFSFAEINEAINFKLKITQYCPVKEKKINEDVINISKSGKLTKERSLSPNEMEIIKGKLEKPTNFKHLNHISWNAITKTFDFSQLSKEFKTIFKNAGIKKKEMKNTETALAIYEALLNQTDLNFSNTQNKKKNKNSDQDKRKSIFGGKGRDRSKSKIVKEERKSKIDIIFNNSIPPPPPPPPPPPFSFPPPLMNQSITLLKPGVSNIKAVENKSNLKYSKPNEDNRSNLIEQIKAGNFKLKKVELNQPEVIAKPLSQQEQISLTSTLAKAIAERRRQMMKGQDSESEEQESDWSEDN